MTPFKNGSTTFLYISDGCLFSLSKKPVTNKSSTFNLYPCSLETYRLTAVRPVGLLLDLDDPQVYHMIADYNWAGTGVTLATRRRDWGHSLLKGQSKGRKGGGGGWGLNNGLHDATSG